MSTMTRSYLQRIHQKPETTIMANCAQVTLKDNYATNGVIHMVDKVIVPTKSTIFEILADDDQFKTLKGALEAKGLNAMLPKAGHLLFLHLHMKHLKNLMN